MTDIFKQFGVGLDEEALRLEGERIHHEHPTTNADIEPKLLANLNDAEPEFIWQCFFQSMPELMKRVDVMLVNGVAVEWLVMREPITSLPVEIQTAVINSLHWRQQDLAQKAALRARLIRK